MSNYIFYIVTIIVIIAYRNKYAKKAEADIRKYNDIKDENESTVKKNEFLKTKIFCDLKNLNDGFDDESIYYFSESEFEVVINRVEYYGIGISEIETWLNGEFYGVKVFKDYCENYNDSQWYRKAFKEFKEDSEKSLLYSASFEAVL